MFDRDTDPWSFRTRWYEERKRAILMATLPFRKFETAFEPGCANGEFSAALAPRCNFLLATDISRAAIKLATERLRHLPQVSIEQMQVPRQWPDQSFQLIVVNELAYFLEMRELAPLCQRIRETLTPDGIFVACHWCQPINSDRLGGAAIHRKLHALLGFKRTATHIERDFILDIWSRDGKSVGQTENLW